MDPNRFPTSQDLKPEQLTQRPGHESKMEQEPIYQNRQYKASGRLQGKTAIITGGDSGIGRAVAIAYAREGAKVTIVYLEEHEDAQKTAQEMLAYGCEPLLLAGDVGNSKFCKEIVEKTLKRFGRIDLLVNNAGEQHPQDRLQDITDEQLSRTFKTNFFGMFYLTREALPHLPAGSCIINTTSVTAFRGSPDLLDYSATKGAVAAFTRSLSSNLAAQQIRVNQVAPGPIWTPLIPSTFPPEKVEKFGSETPMKRPGQPVELAEAYVFLADAQASSYMTGQTIHIGGGEIFNA